MRKAIVSSVIDTPVKQYVTTVNIFGCLLAVILPICIIIDLIEHKNAQFYSCQTYLSTYRRGYVKDCHEIPIWNSATIINAQQNSMCGISGQSIFRNNYTRNIHITYYVAHMRERRFSFYVVLFDEYRNWLMFTPPHTQPTSHPNTHTHSHMHTHTHSRTPTLLGWTLICNVTCHRMTASVMEVRKHNMLIHR